MATNYSPPFAQPFVIVGGGVAPLGGGKLRGHSQPGTAAAATAANQGYGKRGYYHIKDANGLHVATFGPIACAPAAIQAAQANMLALVTAALGGMNA